MIHFHTRLKQLTELLDTYRYPEPFAAHLKKYLQKHKNLGGRDRRELRELSYSFFRLSRALEGESRETIARYAAVFSGFAMADEDLLPLSEAIKNTETLEERVALFRDNISAFDPSFIFPFSEFTSPVFHNEEFQYSFLQQPRVWIKLRKGYETAVMNELARNQLEYDNAGNGVLSFASEAKLTELKSFEKGMFRIQDLSSQQTADDFMPKAGETWWDCCAGSGGKSLALLERSAQVQLYASDIRESILNNLTNRLKDVSDVPFNIFAADVSNPLEQRLPAFDGIIIDAPCTGSGTWARTPESLSYFDSGQIPGYQVRQLSILENVYPFLKKGKPLIYITCSVFSAENEDVIAKFTADRAVKIEIQKYLEGYRHGAENMFLCRMIKTEE